ncbi:MAG TPA: hypothetical protein PL180_08175 [Spirochaetota bacterium]|nr:hypothetical protein [Spirochaetota bacterium]
MPFLAPAANGESGMVSRIKDSGPEVMVDLPGPDAIEASREMFESTWPKALQRLKAPAGQREKVVARKRSKPRMAVHRARRKR